MKTLILAALTAALLVGCSSTDSNDDNDSDPSSPLRSAVESAEGDTSLRELGYEKFREQQPGLTAGITDEQIDELAEVTCDAWDSGATPEDMVMESMGDGLEAEVGSLMALSALIYCPEHKDMLDEFMENHS